MTAGKSVTWVALVVASLGGFSRTAVAAGSANSRMGGEEGTPVSANPNALYYNPGALGFVDRTMFGLYGGLTLRDASWTKAARAAGDTPDPDGANTGTARVLNVIGGVSSFGAVTQIGNLHIGAGFFSPIAGIQRWQTTDKYAHTAHPLEDGGIQRFFGIDDYEVMLYFSAGAAYRLGPLSIGATGNFISTTLKHTESRAFSGSGIPDETTEGTSTLDVSGFSGSFAGGAMLEVVPEQLWLGASYQSQPGLGPITLAGSDGALTNVHPPDPKGHVKVDTYAATFTQSFPDVIRAGIRYRPRGAPMEFRLFGDWTRWGLVKTQCTGVEGHPCAVDVYGAELSTRGTQTLQNNVVYDRDSFGIRGGYSYWTSPGVEVFVGVGYETAASIAATMNPENFDLDNVTAVVGGKFRLTSMMALSIEYTQYYGFPRDNTGQSRLYANPVPVQVPTLQADAGGVYKDVRSILNGSLEVRF